MCRLRLKLLVWCFLEHPLFRGLFSYDHHWPDFFLILVFLFLRIVLVLGSQIHDFWVILGAQGLILEAWGPILTISWIFVILGTFSARNTQALFEVKMRPRTNFLQCCFSMFFWVPTFLDFLWFEVPGGSILAPFRLLFGSPGPLKKQLKVCNYRQIQRFGPFETESFCRPRSGRRFDD